MTKTNKLHYVFGDKHVAYMRACHDNTINVAEGAVRAGKTVDNVFAFAYELEHCPDRIHLATGSTEANAKLNIGDCNGFGLEYIFRGRCKWGKFKGNACLTIQTQQGSKVVIFAGGAKADSYKKIRGNSYGMWIATEINLHHDNTIKEAFNRQLAAKRRKVFWDLNPDNPNATIYKQYIDVYAEKQSKDAFLPGYNYSHFTIFDNATVSKSRLDEIISQYDKESIWYRRDILGQRCVAEGLIYPLFANNEQDYYIDKDELPTDKKTKRFAFSRINVGIDFGGNGSAHSFVASGFDADYKNVYVLRSKRIPAKDVDVNKLIDMILAFCTEVEKDFGVINCIYPDSAEQTIINTLKSRSRWTVHNSRKYPINDRIRCEDVLLSTHRLHIVRDSTSALADALKGAVWDAKHVDEDIRLDNGTSDIDTLDAFEYSFERCMRKLIKYTPPEGDNDE